ncbi:MAG TPA: MFS transporter [Steroidobacteraceae bacterium]|jgi:MFS family permease|nr:MFS transporter [Steroidobacteraceae bacterium]
MSQRPSDFLGGRAFAIEMRTLLLLGLAWGFAYWDRMSITFLSPFIVPELHLTNFELSALPAALAFTWAIGAYLIGFWSDRTGARKPFLLGALVVFSLCSVLSGLATSFWSLFAARLVMGAVEGPFLPICLAILAAVTAERRRGLNAGITQNFFGSVIGTTLAPIVLVPLAVAYSWHAAFYLSGVPGLILALLIWWLVDEPPRAAVLSPAQATREPSASVWAMLANRNIALCCGISILMVGSLVIGSIFLPQYLISGLHVSPQVMAHIMAVLGFCPAIGGVFGPWLSDRFGRRPVMIGFCVLMALCPAAVLMINGSVVLMTTLMAVSWIGAGSFPLFMGVVPAETLAFRRAATAMGLVIGVGEIGGGVLSPLVAGKLADLFSLAAPLIFQGIIPLVAAVLALGLRETNPRFALRAVAQGA